VDTAFKSQPFLKNTGDGSRDKRYLGVKRKLTARYGGDGNDPDEGDTRGAGSWRRNMYVANGGFRDACRVGYPFRER